MGDAGALTAEQAAWAVLASAAGVGPATFGSLVRRFGSAAAVLAAAAPRPGAADLRRPPPDPDPGAFDPFRAAGAAGVITAGVLAAAADGPSLLERIAASGVTVLTAEDGRYPARLRSIDLAPPVLYVAGPAGALDRGRAVAVVGTRRPSEAGRRLAWRIGGELAGAGVSVVSGLAVGIDGAAHAGALDERGITVAVLGGGHDRLSPAVHRGLADRIVASGGAVIAELPPGRDPGPGTFPRRNRIISGLADATVVVEAGLRSGALITARWALEQGRECFVVPGALGARASAGNLGFLREHAGLARIVAGIPELLEDLGIDPAAPSGSDDAPSRGEGRVDAGLGRAERTVLRAVDEGIGTVDQLVERTELPAATILGTLTRLELRGLVVSALGRYRPSGPRVARRDARGRGDRAAPSPAFAAGDGAVLP